MPAVMSYRTRVVMPADEFDRISQLRSSTRRNKGRDREIDM
jgi:hypothetical protein